jgi:hypothetical protein
MKKNAFYAERNLSKPFNDQSEEKVKEAIQIIRDAYKDASEKTIDKYAHVFACVTTNYAKERLPVFHDRFTYYPDKRQIESPKYFSIKGGPIRFFKKIEIKLSPIQSNLFYHVARSSIKGQACNSDLLYHMVYGEKNAARNGAAGQVFGSCHLLSIHMTGINHKIKPLGICMSHKKGYGWHIKEATCDGK